MGKIHAVACYAVLLLLSGCQQGQFDATDMAIKDLAARDSSGPAGADAAAHADLAFLGFNPGPNFTVGMKPVWVATGDFNGDGNPDVATANQGSSDVSILLGDGRGNFAADKRIALAAPPAALLTNDFNGDGIADLAVLSYLITNIDVGHSTRADYLSVIFGAATGPLTAKTIMTASSGIQYYGMTTGDWNKDGKADLAVTENGGKNDVLLGDGTGAFAAPTYCQWINHSNWLAAVDLNGDGAPDLVMNDNGVLRSCANDGAGNFSRIAKTAYANTARSSVYAVAADFNGDQRDDLVIADSAEAVTVLLNDGMGGLGAATDFHADGPLGLAVGDFNTDGKLDVAVANTSTGHSISVLLGDGKGSFGALSDLAPALYPTALAVGDFNRDGKDDLAVVSQGINNVRILLSPFH